VSGALEAEVSITGIALAYAKTLALCFCFSLLAGAVTAVRLRLAARRDFPRVRVVKL